MKKRILSLALALMLALSLLPMAALAAENDGYTALSGADSFKGWDGTGSAPDVPYKVHDDLIGGDIYYLPAGYYKLSNDISEISITITGDVTLDLNGKTLTGSSSSPALVVGSISAPIGNLTIQDSTSGAGSVMGSNRAITVYKGSLTLESGTVSGTGEYAISADNGRTVTLRGGTVNGKIVLEENTKLYADGGTVNGAVNNRGGTITRSSDSVTTATEFTGTVNNGGTILWGTYTSAGTVENGYKQDETNSLIGTISGGTFYGKVKNNSYIDMFDNTRSSSISGGDFSQATQRTGVYSVTFDLNGASGTDPATQWRANGTATQPDDPTPPTANDCFGGWYTDANGTTEYSFESTVTADITLYAKWQSHTYEWKTENGQYWQKCKNCGDETARKDIPTITITGADKVCQTQDYTFTVTVPEDAAGVTYGYDLGERGDSGKKIETDNGVYSATIASYIIENETSFELTVEMTGADGYTVSTSKTVQILSVHNGGTATCKEKAKCEVCHEEYGEINAANHATLKHVEAKAATIEAEGNIEYWHCEECGKYFRDEAGKEAIELSDTVIEKLTPTPAPTAAPTATPAPKAPNTADEANGTLWLALAMLSMMAVVVVARKKEG